MMKMQSSVICGKEILLFGNASPGIVLLQPIDGRDESALESEAEYIAKRRGDDFLLCGVKVSDWFSDLSPWESPAVFADNDFGSGAAETLAYITDSLLPSLDREFGISNSIPKVIGGYSLAGLFALWSGYQTEAFAAVAAASPSVWFPGWINYAREHKMLARAVSLSLGDREEKAKNPVMASVGRRIKEQFDILKSDGSLKVIFRSNEGNHFKEPDVRMAKAFLDVMFK